MGIEANTTGDLSDFQTEVGNPREDRSSLDPLHLFEVTVLDLVQHMFEELVEYPDKLQFNYTIERNRDKKNRSEYKAFLTVHVPEKEMGKVLGKRMKIYSAIKTLGFSVASKNNFFLAMQIQQSHDDSQQAS